MICYDISTLVNKKARADYDISIACPIFYSNATVNPDGNSRVHTFRNFGWRFFICTGSSKPWYISNSKLFNLRIRISVQPPVWFYSKQRLVIFFSIQIILFFNGSLKQSLNLCKTTFQYFFMTKQTCTPQSTNRFIFQKSINTFNFVFYNIFIRIIQMLWNR